QRPGRYRRGLRCRCTGSCRAVKPVEGARKREGRGDDHSWLVEAFYRSKPYSAQVNVSDAARLGSREIYQVNLTLHADYSLRILLYLSEHRDRPVSTQEISEAYGISRNHLVRVVQT